MRALALICLLATGCSGVLEKAVSLVSQVELTPCEKAAVVLAAAVAKHELLAREFQAASPEDQAVLSGQLFGLKILVENVQRWQAQNGCLPV